MSRQHKITFRVNIDPDMDELFGNVTIIAMRRHRIVGFGRKYIPLAELTQERIQEEVARMYLRKRLE